MKNQKIYSAFYYALLVLLFSVLFVACSQNENNPVEIQDDNNSESTAVTTEEAANAVALSLSAESSYGMCAALIDAEEVINESEITTIFDTTFTIDYSYPPYAYDANVALELLYVDNGNNNDQVILDYNSTSNFSSVRISGSHNATGDFTAALPKANESEYIMNGNYKWAGEVNSNLFTGLSYTALVSVDVTSLKIDKDNEDIESGSAAVIVSGTTVDGENFTYSGKITFYEGTAAQLELEGKQYKIDIYRGIVE